MFACCQCRRDSSFVRPCRMLGSVCQNCMNCIPCVTGIGIFSVCLTWVWCTVKPSDQQFVHCSLSVCYGACQASAYARHVSCCNSGWLVLITETEAHSNEPACLVDPNLLDAWLRVCLPLIILLHCRQGMRADFTVLDGNMLEVLKEGGNHVPAVKATFVSGICRHGCNLQLES